MRRHHARAHGGAGRRGGLGLLVCGLIAGGATPGCLEPPAWSPPSEGAAGDAKDGGSGMPPAGEPPIAAAAAQLPRRGEPALEVMTWNVTWFGDPTHDPADDALQRAGVERVLGDYPADLVGLQEVVSTDGVVQLAAALGYAVVHTEYPWPQQLALLYRPARFSVRSREALVDVESAGRPPLSVTLWDGDRERELRVVVVHAKAGTSAGDWQARARFAEQLGAHLDALESSEHLLVLGDLNDELTGSIVQGRDSPYATLLPRVSAPSAALELARREASSVWGSFIDHVLLAGALGEPASATEDEVDVLRDELLPILPAFTREVSDHFPVRLHIER